MKIDALLKESPRPVHTVALDESVEAAIELMSGRKVGAVIVVENNQPVGIFAERDVFQCLARDKNAVLSELTVRNAMTAGLIAAKPGDDVGRTIAVMLKANVRHLPIMENAKVLAMLHLNDLIERQIESLTDEINQLNDYIEDLHEAGRD